MVNTVLTYMLKKCYVSKLTCLSLLDFKRNDNATDFSYVSGFKLKLLLKWCEVQQCRTKRNKQPA